MRNLKLKNKIKSFFPNSVLGRSRYRQWKQRQPENQILEDYDVEEWRDTGKYFFSCGNYV